MKEEKLITVKEASSITGQSTSSIWRKSKTGQFPEPLKLSVRCTRWKITEVQKWMDSLPRLAR